MSATRKTTRMTAAQWRAVAEALAVELAAHAYCEEHPESAPDPGCPCCGARAAYSRYLQAGGADSRLKFEGPSVEVWEIRARRVASPTNPHTQPTCSRCPEPPLRRALVKSRGIAMLDELLCLEHVKAELRTASFGIATVEWLPLPVEQPNEAPPAGTPQGVDAAEESAP